MQTLDIITVNIWSILISLANLVILFFILKHFLYKPLKNVLAQRRESIDKQYEAADVARISAETDQKEIHEKLLAVKDDADVIIKEAETEAQRVKENIVSEANDKAELIIKNAQNEAEAERKKAEMEIKTRVTDISVALAEKMIDREINKEDHKVLIDSFINEVGDSSGGNA